MQFFAAYELPSHTPIYDECVSGKQKMVVLCTEWVLATMHAPSPYVAQANMASREGTSRLQYVGQHLVACMYCSFFSAMMTSLQHRHYAIN